MKEAAGIAAGLETAVAVARLFGCYLEGLFVQQTPQVLVSDPGAVAPAYLTELTEDWRAEARKARTTFSEFMKRQGIPFGSLNAPRDGAFAGWFEVEGREGDVVGEYGRLFDLIVIPRTARLTGTRVSATCEAALFESGRAVLLAPPRPAAELGRTVVIAWNGSTETARTIALGMDFLQNAEKVYVLTVQGAVVPGPTGEQVAEHLLRRGAKVIAVTVEPAGRPAGEAILEEAAALGADLLFKGAYTQSRLRQMIFGGATRHILGAADLPVLMAN